MKNENEFNADLGKELRKSKLFSVIKSSDKFKAGIPDFFVFGPGKTLHLECKFIAELPKKGVSKVLKHKISPSQINHMVKVASMPAQAWGILVGVKEYGTILYFESNKGFERNFLEGLNDLNLKNITALVAGAKTENVFELSKKGFSDFKTRMEWELS
jgi:hypothetical protein